MYTLLLYEVEEYLPKETVAQLKNNFESVEIYHQEQLKQIIEGYSNLMANTAETNWQVKGNQPLPKLVRDGCKASFQSQIKSI